MYYVARQNCEDEEQLLRQYKSTISFSFSAQDIFCDVNYTEFVC
jgi:hypothetical protein